ncbi:peptide ABC transporter substrate-binding protein [Microbulbifer guangxiensis]|uniref:peptide ABC transporter substrate-binding protein n=1 Tax=Microbulbifer guangxiensis TaxID=2904249 RepID=UPI001F1FFC54|nr:peptide ABC transporter substrate-binding protein [Microbulbifer guangxiensis]
MYSHRYYSHKACLGIPLFGIPLTALLLASCGNEQNDSRHAFATNALATLPTRQEVIIGNYHEPVSLDPHHSSSSNDTVVIRDLLEGLVLHGADGELIPAVAERWVTADAQRYTFHLRRDAKWSNGDPVTSADFVYAWRRAVNPVTASRCAEELVDTKVANAKSIVEGKLPPEQIGVRATNAYTLEVTLEQPVGYFVEALISRCFLPLHLPTIEQYGSSWTGPEHFVGNGAFLLESWSVNESLILKRNPLYREADKVHLEKITYLPIASAHTELRRYLADEIDITYSAPSEQIENLRRKRPDELLELVQPSTFGIEINHTKPPFGNPDVRRALALALDRELLVHKVLKTGSPAYRLTPAAIHAETGQDHPWLRQSQTERERLARELYTKAGYSLKNPLRFRVFHKNNDDTHKMLLAAAAMWKEVLGAEATVQSFELKSLIPLIEQRDFDLSTRGLGASYPDSSDVLSRMLTGRPTTNGYSNPRFDELLEQAISEQDKSVRAELYAEAEYLLAEDMPFIPLYNRGLARLVKPHVRGYQPSPLGYQYSKDLWINTEGNTPGKPQEEAARQGAQL